MTSHDHALNHLDQTDQNVYTSRATLVLKRFCQHRFALAALIIIAVLTVSCWIVPLWLPWSYLDADYESLLCPPNRHHWLGTNQLGQDLLAQTLHGMQKSLLIGFAVGLISTGIAASIGAISGYFLGWTDRILMWVVDLLLVVPSFVLITIMTPRVKSSTNIGLLIVLLAGFSWMVSARMVRGLTMSLRGQDFIRAAQYFGISHGRIIVTHIIPNVASILIIDITLNIAQAILAETGLSYLGFGIQPPEVSLGTLIAEGTHSAITFPWVFLFPAGGLITILICANLIGDGLRDAFDPSSTTHPRP